MLTRATLGCGHNQEDAILVRINTKNKVFITRICKCAKCGYKWHVRCRKECYR